MLFTSESCPFSLPSFTFYRFLYPNLVFFTSPTPPSNNPFLHLKLVFFPSLFNIFSFFLHPNLVFLFPKPPPLLINAFLHLNLVLFPFPLLHFIVLHPNLVCFYFPKPHPSNKCFFNILILSFLSSFTFTVFYTLILFFLLPQPPLIIPFLHLNLVLFPFPLLHFIVFFTP